jgi:hypothetical protein
VTPPIHGRKFLEALAETGIISVDDHIRRVIIDASVDSAVTMYVERFGDERLLSVSFAGFAKSGGGLVIRTVPFDDLPAEVES